MGSLVGVLGEIGSAPGTSPPGAALWRKKRWGCHCITKRKTPRLMFSLFLVTLPCLLRSGLSVGPQCVIFPFLQLGIAYTPTGTFASIRKLSRPTAHPSGRSGFLLARATWLPESSSVKSRGRCRKPVSVGPQRGHPPPGNLGDLEGRGRACWETCPRPWGFAGGVPA